MDATSPDLLHGSGECQLMRVHRFLVKVSLLCGTDETVLHSACGNPVLAYTTYSTLSLRDDFCNLHQASRDTGSEVSPLPWPGWMSGDEHED